MSNTTQRMSRVLDEAVRLVSEKNTTYEDAWREHGWRGSLGKVLTKASRLRNMLWRPNNSLLNGEKETPREICLDMINHLVFMVLNMDEGREWGHEVNSPMTGEYPNGGSASGASLDYSSGWPDYARTGQLRVDALKDPMPTGQLELPAEGTSFEVPVPGEMSAGDATPSPIPRSQRGRGSGPRKVKDQPQA